MKKSEVVCGACFGYFDAKKFEECRACKISLACEKASNSEKIEEIKKKEKKTIEEVEELVKEFS